VPAGRVGGLGAALSGHGLQGGDVDLHGSSSVRVRPGRGER
jgi:hypothetical protein